MITETITITGNIDPGRQDDIMITLDDLLQDFTNPIMIAHMDTDSAHAMKQYARSERLTLFISDERPYIADHQMTEAPHLIIIAPTTRTTKIHRQRQRQPYTKATGERKATHIINGRLNAPPAAPPLILSIRKPTAPTDSRQRRRNRQRPR